LVIWRRLKCRWHAAPGPTDQVFDGFRRQPMSIAFHSGGRKSGYYKVPSVGPKGPKRLLVSLFLSMAVCLPAKAGGPSLFQGDTITVRLTQALDSGRNHTGDRFDAVVDRDVEANGAVIIPKGSLVHGDLKEVISSGRLKRRAELTIEISTVEISGRTLPVDSQPETRLGSSHATHDGKFIGGGALLGLVVGALAGGGKGAAIGSLTGAAVGAGGASVSGKSELHIPAETVLNFRLNSKFAPELP
jgi:hypothetical protein